MAFAELGSWLIGHKGWRTPLPARPGGPCSACYRGPRLRSATGVGWVQPSGSETQTVHRPPGCPRSSFEEHVVRYGMNPHQSADVVSDTGAVSVVSGEPSLINYLDALKPGSSPPRRVRRPVCRLRPRSNTCHRPAVPPPGLSTTPPKRPGESRPVRSSHSPRLTSGPRRSPTSSAKRSPTRSSRRAMKPVRSRPCRPRSPARSSSCKQIPTHPYPDVAAGSSSARRIGSASSTARFGDHAIELFDDAGWRTPWTRQQTGLTLGSDGFIPFRDNVDFAAEGGVTTIVEPGGSLRTPQVEAGCQELGIRHIATGLRLFHH